MDPRLCEGYSARDYSRYPKLLRDEPGAFLVFARTKHGTDRLAKNLARFGLDSARIHGDRTQGQRNQALQGFKDGTYRVLVATDVAARGIHVDNIAHVVNFDLPQVPEDFIHRAGRTGRAGREGTAITLVQPREHRLLQAIEKVVKQRIEPARIPTVADVKARHPHLTETHLTVARPWGSYTILEEGPYYKIKRIVVRFIVSSDHDCRLGRSDRSIGH